MRTIIDRLGWGIAGASTLALVLIIAGVVSAGPLDPSGPPSSTSGVLRPGTPITSLPYTITTPGSYYLIGNLTGTAGQSGITISSDDVSLDLGGFTLQGVVGSSSGVRVGPQASYRAITIRNGTARGWGDSGIQAQLAYGGVYDSLTAEGNSQWGFVIGYGGNLTHCAANNNGGSGVSAESSTISECSALTNGGNGFQINRSVLANCVSEYNTFAGIDALSSSHVDSCHAWQNHTVGIRANSSTVTGNESIYNDSHGIEVLGTGSLVSNNQVYGNSFVGAGAGILVSGSDARIDGNHVTDQGNTPSQDVGINVTGANNAVINNSAHGNGANYSLTGIGGTYGPLSTAASATNPFTNIDY